MTSTTFISKVTTIATAWLQDVNDFVYSLGAKKSDLAASSGAGSIGYIPPQAGAVATTVQTVLRESLQASRFATGGLGTLASPFTGWETVFAVANDGQQIEFDSCYYTSAGGWTLNKSVSLKGKGSGTHLMFTGIAGSSVNIGIGGITFNGTPRAAYPGTVYNMGTGTVTAGQTVFTFASVAGLAQGDEVMLFLGTDPNDAGQSFLRMFARVTNIGGNNVTFSPPVPEAVTSVAWGGYAFSPTFNECVKFTNGIVQNISVRDMTITQTAGPAYDFSLFFQRCKNVYVDGLYFDDITSGIVFGECENVRIGMINGRRIRATLLGIYGCRNVRGEIVSSNDMTGTGLYLENQNRGININSLKLFGGNNKVANGYIFVGGGSLGVNLDNIQLSGPVMPTAPGLVVLGSSQVTLGDIQIDANINTVMLKYCKGNVVFGGNQYRDLKRFRISVPIYLNMALVSYNLPNGLLRSLKGSLSNTTGITHVRLKTTTTSRDILDVFNTINFFPAAGVFGELTTDDFVTTGTDATTYAFNADATGHQLQISTDGTAVEGTMLILEGEVYVRADDQVLGQQQLGVQATLSSLKTLNFGVPGSVPGSVDATITVTGAALGDRVVVAAPITIGINYLLTAFVSAADTVTVRWTQIAGAAADPDGGGGVYRVDVWKQ